MVETCSSRCNCRISARVSIAQHGVQIGQRFVEQHHGRFVHDGARDRDTLLLPAGELLRRPVMQRIQPDTFQGTGDAARDVRRRERRERATETRHFRTPSYCGHIACDWNTMPILR